MKESKILIHTAMLPEAKPIIGHLRLQRIQNNLYENEQFLLCVSGIGLAKTQESLEELFQNYSFSKAFNIGIAGCCDKEVDIGTLFCTTHNLSELPFATISSFETPVIDRQDIQTLLVDMESESFIEVCKKHLKKEDIFVFKVVSDYLSDTIPTKAFVNSLIQKNLKKVFSYV